MRRLAFVVAALLALLPGRSARAAGECPDGAWFCEPAPEPPAPPAAGEPDEQASPAPAEPEPAGSEEPGGEVRIDVPRVEPAPRKRRYREWGVNVHGASGLLGNDRAMSDDAGMYGFGAALRFRPIPHIAVEGSLELLWGTDYNGFDRFEDAVLVSALFFANPRSAVQLYGVAGVGLAVAWLDRDSGPGDAPRPRDDVYTYAGAQLGFGVEARITRRFALGGDLIGFLRHRTDRFARQNPEFVERSTHRATNASGGGLVRLGATLYW